MYLIIGLILLIFIIIKFRLLINFKSFFKRGFRPIRGKWGIYCYHGSQGKGKTFSLTEYVVTHKDKSIYYSNYHLNGIEYNFYTGFDGLMRIKDDLDNGKIINEGSHSYLLKNCDEYRKLYEAEIKNRK